MRDYRDSDYLAGFIDGEGCFTIEVREVRKKKYAQTELTFSLAQRKDAVHILELLRDCFGGRIHVQKASKGYVCAQWRINARREILSLIKYLDAHLLVVKLEEYKLWREAAFFYFRHSVGQGRSQRPWLADAMRAYKEKLQALKKYIKPTQDIDVDFDDAQETFDY